MAKELLYPHKPKSRQPLYPHTVHLSESDVIRLAKSWLNEWATKFKITCPGLRIATEGDLISFDHIGYSVVIDIPFIELVKKHREVLPALKYAVAHEFGHAKSLNRYGIEAYVRKLRQEYPELEEEADNIAEQLTGLTNKQAWDLMEWYEDDSTTPPEEEEAPDDYWNRLLENNPLRVQVGETMGGAEVSWVLEAAGDILRNYHSKYPDPGYITEKVRRIDRESRVREWSRPISTRDQDLINKNKELLCGLPAPTVFHQDLKRVMEAILARRPSDIRGHLEDVKKFLREKKLLNEYDLETVPIPMRAPSTN